MKRQPKPFAVEIKRSRRPTFFNAGSESDPLQRGTEFLETVTINKVFLNPSPANEPEIVVPAFLQSAKESFRPAHPDVKPAEAPKQSFWKQESLPSGKPATPRILPSLAATDNPVSANKILPSKVPEPEVKEQVKKPAVRAVAKKRAAVKQMPLFSSAPVATEKHIPNTAVEPGSSSPQSKAEAHEAIGHRGLRRTLRSLKADKDSIAALPPGQRWKRRLHIRAR